MSIQALEIIHRYIARHIEITGCWPTASYLAIVFEKPVSQMAEALGTYQGARA